MRTETEIRIELEQVEQDIKATKKFLNEDVKFRVDEEMMIEDLIFLEKRRMVLKWVLS